MLNYLVLLLVLSAESYAQKPNPALNTPVNNFFNNIIPPGTEPFRTDTIYVYLEHAEASMAVKKGSKFQVRFPEKAGGTGFTWNIAGKPASCKLINTERITNNHRPGMTGVPQTTILTFIAIKKGTENIRFTFNRVWEKNVPPSETKLLHLKVK